MKDDEKSKEKEKENEAIAHLLEKRQTFFESLSAKVTSPQRNELLINLTNSFDQCMLDEFIKEEAIFLQKIKNLTKENILDAIIYCIETGKNRALISLYNHLKNFHDLKSGEQVFVSIENKTDRDIHFIFTDLLRIIIENLNYEALTILIYYGYPINLSSWPKLKNECFQNAMADAMRISEFIAEERDPKEFPDHIAFLMVATLSETDIHRVKLGH